MAEFNIYSGRKGKIEYQETGNFDSLLKAELYAQKIAKMDANEFGYPIEECDWLAVETAIDSIPYDKRVGVMYL